MSQDLPTPPNPPEHRVLPAWRAIRAAAAELARGDVWSISDTDLATALDEARAVKAMLAAGELALVGEADGRNVGVTEATTTAGWLRGRLRLHPGEASRMVKLAAAVRSDCAATGAALSAGSLSAAHAQTISEVVGQLPPVDRPTRVRAEEFLIGQAGVLDPLLLKRAGHALIETLTTVPDADGRLARQREQRELSRTVVADGMVRYLAWLVPEADATLGRRWVRCPRPGPRPTACPIRAMPGSAALTG